MDYCSWHGSVTPQRYLSLRCSAVDEVRYVPEVLVRKRAPSATRAPVTALGASASKMSSVLVS